MLPVRIALLGDNQNIATMQSAMLRAAGFREVTRLESIDILKSAIKHFTFDLLIVNDLGSTDPMRAAALFRDEVNTKDPFMISLLVTAKTSRSSIRHAIGLGYDDVLKIPFSAATLLGKIASLAKSDRRFIRVGGYFGPDRRRVWEGPPVGVGERRSTAGMVGDEIARPSVVSLKSPRYTPSDSVEQDAAGLYVPQDSDEQDRVDAIVNSGPDVEGDAA